MRSRSGRDREKHGVQKVAQQRKDGLGYLGSQMRRTGCIQEMKSLISEFLQYDVSPGQLEELAQKGGGALFFSGS